MASYGDKKLGLLRQSLSDFSDDECPTMAAALSYYTVFSLPPLLVLLLLLLGAVVDPAEVLLATILGVAALILGATGVFRQLQAALNKAWEVEPDPAQGGIKNIAQPK